VDRYDLVVECKTNTNNNSREDLKLEYESFSKIVSSHRPIYVIYNDSESSHYSNDRNVQQSESLKGQHDKGKKKSSL
jgi:hypothetical protein